MSDRKKAKPLKHYRSNSVARTACGKQINWRIYLAANAKDVTCMDCARKIP